MIMKKNTFFLLLFLSLPTHAQIPLQSQTWTVTATVVDEANQPVPDANVEVSYRLPSPADQGEIYQKMSGLSDRSGNFTASHQYTTYQLGLRASKSGYYSTSQPYDLGFSYDVGKWNPTVTLVLKKVIHPIPMYVNRVDLAHKDKPAFDKPVGFDLTAGDFVAPYGKGTTAHMFFEWHTEYDTNDVSAKYGTLRKHGWESKLTITFPNAGDGIQEFDTNQSDGSELRSSQEAPAEGYLPTIVKLQSWHPGGVSTNSYDHIHKNYYIRVETLLDLKGNVKSAHYGKIYGDFDEVVLTYLNPQPSSRDLEFDLKSNLGTGGVSGWAKY